MTVTMSMSVVEPDAGLKRPRLVGVGCAVLMLRLGIAEPRTASAPDQLDVRRFSNPAAPVPVRPWVDAAMCFAPLLWAPLPAALGLWAASSQER